MVVSFNGENILFKVYKTVNVETKNAERVNDLNFNLVYMVS